MKKRDTRQGQRKENKVDGHAEHGRRLDRSAPGKHGRER
jgi:hypothetical protein